MSDVDADQILSQFPGPVTMHTGRAKWLWLLLIAIILASGGVWEISKGEWIGWPTVSFFGLGAVVFAASLLPGATILTLDADGFQMTNLFRGARLRWQDVAGFRSAAMLPLLSKTTLRLPLLPKTVFFSVSTMTGRPLAKLNVAISGRNAMLPDTYGLSADELARLMERWRDRAVAQ